MGPVPLGDLGDGTEAKIKYDHVACQNKGNDACNNVVAIILPVDTPSTWGWGQNCFFFFLKVVMLHIKLKRVEHRTPCKHIFCPYAHPRLLGLGQKVKTFFSESNHVAYQI